MMLTESEVAERLRSDIIKKIFSPKEEFNLDTKELLKEIEDKGITICYITLHVGLGTFRPVAVSDITKHKMHSEFYSMSKETAKILNEAKKNGQRIISVGTTTTRTLETIMNRYGADKYCFEVLCQNNK